MIQNCKAEKPLVCLFDSGSSHTWFKRKSLPKGCNPIKCERISSSTLAGSLNSNQQVELQRLVFPEFFKTRFVDSAKARVFDNTQCRYDVIFGRDFLRELTMRLDFSKNKMSWDECHVPMRTFPISRKISQKTGVIDATPRSIQSFDRPAPLFRSVLPVKLLVPVAPLGFL